MTDPNARMQRYEDVVQRLGSALRGARLYSSGHPQVRLGVSALHDAMRQLLSLQPSVLIGFIKDEIIVDDRPLPKASSLLLELIHRLKSLGIHKISIEYGVTEDELLQFVLAVTEAVPRSKEEEEASDDEIEFISLPHLRAGRILVEQDAGSWGGGGGAANARRVYQSSMSAAKTVWESAKTDGRPELPTARDAVDNLADAVAHNRSAIVGLTSMQKHDNYTFTHMVNVSILTMGQARALGMDGRRLRELGLAALMHDIGKVRTPTEILSKPEKLTDQEFTIMKRHTTDGAEILRRTPEMPVLAPIVAFEHHLRLDGTGYPEGVARQSLNIATMLCSISDVYDAMRSQRKYQEAFPSDRILAVMKRNDGRQFDQNLVRRFVQLIGIYPPGNLVRLTTGEVAVVTHTHAPDPHRPAVRVVFDQNGRKLKTPVERNLWEYDGASAPHMAVAAPVDPSTYDIDALSLV